MKSSSNRPRRTVSLVLLLATIFGGSFALSGCDHEKPRVKAALDAYLKGFGARDVQYDTYVTDPAYPNKAYFAVTITWNQADRRGNFQKEALGYILNKADDKWTVNRQAVSYTKDKDQGKRFLSGQLK
ncbi:MAG TPA: hypothetical protein VI756_20460 [Blastocatellia bacterium]